jgi:hypothetical protein
MIRNGRFLRENNNSRRTNVHDLTRKTFYLSIHPSINTSISLPIHQSIGQPIYPSIHPSIHLSTQLSIYPPNYLSIHLSIYLWLYSRLLDLGRFFNLLILYIVGRTSRTGESPLEGRYQHTEQHKHRINGHRHPCFELDSNP